MNQVLKLAHAHHNGKYLQRGESFAEEILEEIKYLKKANITYQGQELLHQFLFESAEESRAIELILYLFNEHVFLDYNFAKQLNLFETFNPVCLLADSELSRSLIALLESSSILFMVIFKRYPTMDSIYLELEAFIEVNHREVLCEAITGGFK